ncbi:hypothetical protein [Microvirga lupini]|nr:hypothetical protein [Microvirga lupini]
MKLHAVASVIEETSGDETRAEFVRRIWHKFDRPIVWLDPETFIDRFPVVFSRIDADFAARRKEGGAIHTGPLYFGKSEAAGALLDAWVRNARDYLDSSRDPLLDAWNLLSHQGSLRSFWLP